MPAASDISQFVRCQVFETPSLPAGATFAGRTIVITGANTGLGLECAKQVAALNATSVILGCRSPCKGEAAKQKIMHYASVKAFAARLAQLDRVDAVLANAGISTNQYATAEGIESTLTVNVVSTFLLGALLLPSLEKTAALTGQATHLTIVGSNVHAFADHTQLQHCPPLQIFKTLSKQETADMGARYFLSKLMVMQFARELSTTISASSVVINCPSPGWCKTELFRQDDGGFWGRNMLKLIGRSAEEGARCLTAALLSGEETHGQYLSECKVEKPSVFVKSPEGAKLQGQVWSELGNLLISISPELKSVLQQQ